MSSQKSPEITQKQFDMGTASYLSILIAQRQYRQDKIALIEAQAARYGDSAAFLQVLGGGWWSASETRKPEKFEKGSNRRVLKEINR